MEADLIEFPPRWESQDVLRHAAPEIFEKASDNSDGLIDLFETDAASEYDARNLYALLKPILPNWPQPVTSYFHRWQADERNHYSGLRRLWSLASGRQESDLDLDFSGREPDFGPLTDLLSDPFRLMVALAYDERVTVQAYAVDYALYDRLGPAFGRWVRLTNRDEAYHYRNAIKIVRHLYSRRLHEVFEVLERLLEHDLARTPYRATFLLDHDDGGLYFTEARLRKCAEIVGRQLS